MQKNILKKLIIVYVAVINFMTATMTIYATSQEIKTPVLIRDEDVIWSIDPETGKQKATYKNGNPIVGWFDFVKDGVKSRFCFNEKGVVHTDWYQEGINIYFFDSNGRMITGEANIDGERYVFDEEGRYKGISNYEVELKNFFTNNPDFIITNSIGNGEVFYAKSKTTDEMVVYRNFWFESESTGEKSWYATDNEGHLLTGFVKYNANVYYLSERKKDIGKMLKNFTLEKNGKNYVFDEEGRFLGDKNTISEPVYTIN